MDEPRVEQIVDRRYRLKREIARGGVAIVFEADHLFTDRAVALKMLSAKVAGDQEARRRLLLEAKALTSARHPNVVAVLDAGLAENDAPFLVMEMLEGRSLDGILTARSTTSTADAVHLVVQVCEALSFMHARGLIHRDIKPGNIFLARSDTGEEVVKLVDFGIAALGEQPSPEGTKITQQGEVLGTPEYMAPEQLMLADDVDHRADIYAVGVVLHECLLGSVPFAGNYAQVLLKVNNSPAPCLADSCPALSPRLAAVLERALAKEPADRFGDARDLAQALVNATGLKAAKSALLGIRGARRSESPATLVGMPAAGAERSHKLTPARRRFARAPYVTPVHIVEPNGHVILGQSEDISEGGLLVLLPRSCPNGATVEVSFALPTTGEIVTLSAVARWVRASRGVDAIGLELVDPSAALRATIAGYVAAVGGTK